MLLVGISKERLHGRSIHSTIHDLTHPPEGEWKHQLEQAETISCNLIQWMKEKRKSSSDIAQWPTAKNLEDFIQDVGL